MVQLTNTKTLSSKNQTVLFREKVMDFVREKGCLPSAISAWKESTFGKYSRTEVRHYLSNDVLTTEIVTSAEEAIKTAAGPDPASAKQHSIFDHRCEQYTDHFISKADDMIQREHEELRSKAKEIKAAIYNHRADAYRQKHSENLPTL